MSRSSQRGGVPDSSRREVLINTLLFKPRDVLKSAVVTFVYSASRGRVGDEEATAPAESTGSADAASHSETDDG